MRTSILAAAAFAAAFGLAPVAGATQNFASLNAAAADGTLDFERAEASMPRLTEVTFEKADLNGDGVISPSELPVLESIYRALYVDR